MSPSASTTGAGPVPPPDPHEPPDPPVAATATGRRIRPAEYLAEHRLTDAEQAAIGTLVAALKVGSGIRAGLRQALDDPGLAVGYWHPEDDAFIDAEGAVVEPTAEAVVLAHRSPVAALVPARPGVDPGLLAAVAVAAASRLERARWGVLKREGETYRKALLDAIPDLMFRLRRDGTYLDFAGDERMLASPAEELVGSNVHVVAGNGSLPATGNTVPSACHALPLSTRRYAPR